MESAKPMLWDFVELHVASLYGYEPTEHGGAGMQGGFSELP